MRIKVVKSITDINGNKTPLDMIGKEFDVIKEEEGGVWVTKDKLDKFLYFEELEILELDDKLSNILFHYLRNTTRNKFYEELERSGCTHLL